MNIKENQDSEMGKVQLPHDVAGQTKSVDESRRGFAKSGLAISGVILTLASRPVMACVCKAPSGFVSGNVSQQGQATPSSGGYSSNHWIDNCDSWKNYCEQSRPFCTEFGFNHNNSSHYGCNNVAYDFKNNKYSKDKGNTYVPYTNLDILCRHHAGYKPSGQQSDCDVRKKNGKVVNTFYTSGQRGDISTYRPIETVAELDWLAQHCVAALINCRAGLTPYLPESTVKEMFNACSSSRGVFHPTAGVDWDASKCIEYIQSTWS